jgi:hypothetical protein
VEMVDMVEIFYILLLPILKFRRKIMMLMISNHLMMEPKETLKLKLDVSIVYDILIFGHIRRLARKGIDVHATTYLQTSNVINLLKLKIM